MKLFKRENYLYKIRGFYHTNAIIKVLLELDDVENLV